MYFLLLALMAFAVGLPPSNADIDDELEGEVSVHPDDFHYYMPLAFMIANHKERNLVCVSRITNITKTVNKPEIVTIRYDAYNTRLPPRRKMPPLGTCPHKFRKSERPCVGTAEIRKGKLGRAKVKGSPTCVSIEISRPSSRPRPRPRPRFDE